MPSPPSEPVSEDRLSIVVNGAAREITRGATITALLHELGFGGRRVAVAINRRVVPRARHASEPLTAGDRVEILEAVGGG